MKQLQGNLRLFFHFAAATLIFAGCQPQAQKPKQACPGSGSVMGSLSMLKEQSGNAKALKASGECFLRYYDENGEEKKENFPVKLWVNPPNEICLQGDVAFDAKGIVVGSNENEFWWSIKPVADSYYWGNWAEQDYFGGIKVASKILLEAIGIIEVDSGQNWSLSSDGIFAVLTKRDRGVETRKIYISKYDCRVGKIAYFASDGKVAAVAEMDRYNETAGGFFVPAFIKVVIKPGDNQKNPVSIILRLSSIKAMNFTEEQKNRLFLRYQPHGFTHIYRISGGSVIEQSQ